MKNVTRRTFLQLVGAVSAATATTLLPVEAGAFSSERKNGKEGHDSRIERMLLGSSYNYKSLGTENEEKAKARIKVLVSATALCLDQMNGNSKDDWTVLSKYNVSPLPTIDEINIQLFGGTEHRQLSHLGWHYTYGGTTNESRPVSDIWKKRKLLLQSSVNKAFDFGLLEEFQLNLLGWFEDTRCDRFAEFLYCVHVLQDYQYSLELVSEGRQDNLQIGSDLIPLTARKASIDEHALFFDIDDSLNILFNNKTTGTDYEALSKKLARLARKARRLPNTIDKESADDALSIVEDAVDCLEKAVPKLLKETDFFKKAFYE